MVRSIVFFIHQCNVFKILNLLLNNVWMCCIEVLVHLLEMCIIKILRFCSEFVVRSYIHQSMLLIDIWWYEECLIFLLFFDFIQKNFVLIHLFNTHFIFVFFLGFLLDTIFNHNYVSIIFIEKRNLKFWVVIIWTLLCRAATHV